MSRANRQRTRMRQVLRGLVGGGLLVAALLIERPQLDPHPGSLTTRLLGPAAELASSAQWIRFQHAVRRGEEARAVALAQAAIRLAPRRTAGWKLLSGHLALDLASPEHEPDVQARRRWFEAGLALAHAGEEEADEPGELALWRALLLTSRLDADPELLGSPQELARRAREALEAATRLGSAEARLLLSEFDER